MKKDLKEILEEHKIWINSKGLKGTKANLSGADLEGVNLRG